VPPSNKSTDDYQEPLDAIPVLGNWVRGVLLGLALGLVLVFGIAIWLDPYDGDGRPLTMETHRQLGLPPCTFYEKTGVPCPSCGMTTSFALLMHGDLGNSLRANWVGTLVAGFCLLFIPWGIACAVCRRILFIRSIEGTATILVIVLLVLMMLRWGFVLLQVWNSGKFHRPAPAKEPAAEQHTRAELPDTHSWRRGNGNPEATLGRAHPVAGRDPLCRL